MYRGDSDGLEAARAQLVSYSARLLDDGLAVGSAGNMSVRAGDTVAITPSGISYAEMRPEDVCLITLDGAEPAGVVQETPSSETPMHLAIYATTKAGAVVHTHSPEVIALSAGREELPAIHYAITGLGGPVRDAPYVRFGSAGLAAAAVAQQVVTGTGLGGLLTYQEGRTGREGLSEAEAAKAWAEGQALTFEEAIAYALDSNGKPPASRDA